MRRTFVLLLATALVLLGSLAVAGGAAAATIARTTTCANGVDDTPGLGLICEVTVVNTITSSGGSARVTVRECHGAAGAPTAACTTTTRNVNQPVTVVRQCNAATNGGGGTLRCSVRVTNNFVGLGTGATAVSINQCVGSGDGIANNCDPFPATTTSATITQCNGSANGGTLVELRCTASGTESSGLGLRIYQCNGSTNGGGALVICSATIANNRVAVGTTGTTGVTLPPTAMSATTEGPASKPDALLLVGIFLLALIGVASHRSLWVSRRR
jgi:hypothetical protein